MGLPEGVEGSAEVSGKELMVLLRGRVGVWGTSSNPEEEELMFEFVTS